MKYQLATAALAGYAAAFPALAPMEAELSSAIKREANPEPAGVVGDLLGGLTGIVEGLLDSVVASVDPKQKRPEPGFKYIAPKSTDSRGPCPGLNLLANYGYLPRNGYVSFGQVLNATARGFNMGADLATVLSVFAVLTDGDIETESWYLGTNPKTGLGGLNRHSTVEADISPNREDYYLGCGDNHHLSSRLFTQNVEIVAASASKQFDINNMGTQYATLATQSKAYNPYLYFFPFPLIVSTAAFAFYPNFFSNGTYGLGGVANYESISSIIGAKYDKKTGQFEYVPEKWPENWYRRSIEYDAVTALTQGIVQIYTRNIVTPGASTLLTPNFNISTLLCDVYQGFESITPLVLAGTETDVEAAITWGISKLDKVFDRTVLGCPTSAYSNVYPNATAKGGPLGSSNLNPPASVQKNAGNNVYNKVYFKTQPTKPQCNHVYNP